MSLKLHLIKLFYWERKAFNTLSMATSLDVKAYWLRQTRSKFFVRLWITFLTGKGKKRMVLCKRWLRTTNRLSCFEESLHSPPTPPTQITVYNRSAPDKMCLVRYFKLGYILRGIRCSPLFIRPSRLGLSNSPKLFMHKYLHLVYFNLVDTSRSYHETIFVPITFIFVVTPYQNSI